MPKSPELGLGRKDQGNEAPEGMGGEFDEIANLAGDALREIAQEEEVRETAAQTATAEEQAKKTAAETKEAQELRESQAGVIDQLSAERQGRLVTRGEEDYYILTQDEAGLKKMGRTFSDADFQRRGRHIELTSPWEIAHSITGPQDFFEAHDKSVAWFDEHIQEFIDHYGDMDEGQLNELIEKRRQIMVEKREFLLIDSRKEGKKGGESYQARDLAPDLFARVAKELCPSIVNRLYEFRREKEDDLVVLRSFSETALKSGDIENALEGFNRLNDLNNAEFTATLKLAIEKLRQSKNSNDQLRLKSILNRIQGIRG